jgi:hypothetical protein
MTTVEKCPAPAGKCPLGVWAQPPRNAKEIASEAGAEMKERVLSRNIYDAGQN